MKRPDLLYMFSIDSFNIHCILLVYASIDSFKIHSILLVYASTDSFNIHGILLVYESIDSFNIHCMVYATMDSFNIHGILMVFACINMQLQHTLHTCMQVRTCDMQHACLVYALYASTSIDSFNICTLHTGTLLVYVLCKY